jgi:hypothetical protein
MDVPFRLIYFVSQVIVVSGSPMTLPLATMVHSHDLLLCQDGSSLSLFELLSPGFSKLLQDFQKSFSLPEIGGCRREI